MSMPCLVDAWRFIGFQRPFATSSDVERIFIACLRCVRLASVKIWLSGGVLCNVDIVAVFGNQDLPQRMRPATADHAPLQIFVILQRPLILAVIKIT